MAGADAYLVMSAGAPTTDDSVTPVYDPPAF